jgi:NADH-quinone oxidoreductase subunit M
MGFLEHWLLTILLLVPCAGAMAVLLIRRPAAVRWTAFAVALATLALSLFVLLPFRWQHGGEYAYGPGGTVQMLCAAEWVPPIHAQYRVAIDGLSYPFVVLTTLLGAIACAAIAPAKRSGAVYAQLLLFEATCLGTFLAFDLFLMFLFLALMMIPAMGLAGMWGSPGRSRAASRLFAYLLVGVLCLLVVMLGEYAASRQALGAGTFDLVKLASPAMHQAFATQPMIKTSRTLFALAMVAFLVRLAVVPFHNWMLELIGEAPAALGMLPIALIPATGAYGILRVALPLFPQAAGSLRLAFAVLAVVSILYAALCALAQDDLRRLSGYAGISLAGFVLLGEAVITPLGANAAVYLAIFQALLVPFLLQLAGALHDRLGHADLTRAAGTAGAMPVYAGFWVLGWFALLVSPGLLGQTLVLLGSYQATHPGSQASLRMPQAYGLIAAACLGIVFTAGYVLSCMRRMFFTTERVSPPAADDLNRTELLILTSFAIVLLALALLPGAMCFTFTRPAIEALFRSMAA